MLSGIIPIPESLISIFAYSNRLIDVFRGDYKLLFDS